MSCKHNPTHRLSQRAQSVIEYTLITALVMVGIFVMGPYLIRSVNSYFKFTEDSVEDSFREDIKQAPTTGFSFPSCECDPPQGQCGTGGGI